MQITKQFIQGKFDNPLLCEDAIFQSDDFIAIIDGVTAKSDFTHKGKKTGRLAAEIVQNALKTMPAAATIEEIIEGINIAFAEFYQTVNFPLDHVYGPQAAMTIYSVAQQEVYIFGDCQVRVDDLNYTQVKKSDEVLANMRALVIKTETFKNGDQVTDEGQQLARQIIQPWLVETTRFMNVDTSIYGYSVLNGQTIPLSLVKSIAVEAGSTITLTSDGYPDIKSDFATTETYLQWVLETDPDCINVFPSTKGLKANQVSFDDRSYIQFKI